MSDLTDGESVQVAGSGSSIYTLKNTGGVFSCTCPAWRNQSVHIDRRTCKHLKKLRGEAVEAARLASAGAPDQLVSQAAEKVKESSKDGPPLLLAHRFDEAGLHESQLIGWWMSEKLDGVRAYWDGKRFISRLGNAFIAPEWFTDNLPDSPLDGELWVGRGQFNKTTSIVRRFDGGEAWRTIRYLVFDAPHLKLPFEERLTHLENLFSGEKHPFALSHAHIRCEGIDHLKRELARVESLQGEGLMLRKPGSSYEVGRSSTLLKVKTFHDAEATVLAHEKGKGKHKGRLGSLLVKTDTGVQFSVGTGFSDQERENPPRVGSVITYRYQELTEAGVPRFPSFVRVRTDV